MEEIRRVPPENLPIGTIGEHVIYEEHDGRLRYPDGSPVSEESKIFIQYAAS